MVDEHKWDCISPGEYDSTYECEYCKKRWVESIDNPIETALPEFGCESSRSPGCYVSEPLDFSYVDVIGEGCEGWLNLFFGQQCVALIANVNLANEIRKSIKLKPRIGDVKWTDYCAKCGVSVPADLVFPHTCIET